jgi:hypothetical protein
VATCTGDQGHDGEAIAFDGNDGAIGTRVSVGATSDPWSLSTIHLFRNTILDVPVGIAISGNSAYPLRAPGQHLRQRPDSGGRQRPGVDIPAVASREHSVGR